MATATFRIWRGNAEGGDYQDFSTEVTEGMVVLDAVHQIQAESANDLAVRMAQSDAERVQEFRKCIECFLCQDVCHVLRDHRLHDEFIGPRFFVHNAQLEMNPLDTEDRAHDLANDHGIGYCNITKCCTKVCPEEITITDNAIIPLKERVVDQLYDPVSRLLRVFSGG